MFKILIVHSAHGKQSTYFHSLKVSINSRIVVDDIIRAHASYGIDRKNGRLVIVSSHQRVSWISDLDDVADLDLFFSSFLRTQSGNDNSRAMWPQRCFYRVQTMPRVAVRDNIMNSTAIPLGHWMQDCIIILSEIRR